MDFIAIDFEIANQKYYSPCQVGIAVVRDFQITDEINEFIYVNRENFDLEKLKDGKLFGDIQHRIHKITENCVKDAPEFDTLYNSKLKWLIEKNPVVAHNTSFDIGVLRQTLELYNINLPVQKFVCTQKISENIHSNCGFKNHKLKTVYKELFKKPLPNHHDAKFDARGCAEIAIKLFKDNSVNDFNKITHIFNVPISDISLADSSSKSSKKGRQSKSQTKSQTALPDGYKAPKDFIGYSIVPSGKFSKVSRKTIEALILKITNTVKVKTSVSKSTNFIVAGDEMGSSKKMKADNWNIPILSEEEFIKKVNYTNFIE